MGIISWFINQLINLITGGPHPVGEWVSHHEPLVFFFGPAWMDMNDWLWEKTQLPVGNCIGFVEGVSRWTIVILTTFWIF